jgi:hypothetical protein
MKLDRREALFGLAATAAAVAAPVVAAAVPDVVLVDPAQVLSPPLPRTAWKFETCASDDIYDVIWADSEQEAMNIIVEQGYADDCHPDCITLKIGPDGKFGSSDECEIEDCGCDEWPVARPEREKHFDGFASDKGWAGIPLTAIKKAGWGVRCTCCEENGAYHGNEYSTEWEIVDDEPYCHECMEELGLWEKVDPEYAAELRRCREASARWRQKIAAEDEARRKADQARVHDLRRKVAANGAAEKQVVLGSGVEPQTSENVVLATPHVGE